MQYQVVPMKCWMRKTNWIRLEWKDMMHLNDRPPGPFGIALSSSAVVSFGAFSVCSVSETFGWRQWNVHVYARECNSLQPNRMFWMQFLIGWMVTIWYGQRCNLCGHRNIFIFRLQQMHNCIELNFDLSLFLSIQISGPCHSRSLFHSSYLSSHAHLVICVKEQG